MAKDTPPPVTGGNKPKPVSAKDASRAKSRPVAGKAPAKGGGKAPAKGAGSQRNGKGGRGPANGRLGKGAKPPSGRGGFIAAWSSVAVVVIVVAVIVIVKATSSTGAALPVTPAPAGVVSQVTGVPAATFDKVGVEAATSGSVTPPTVKTGQPPIHLEGTKPGVLFVGAEYCPYCAAERWGVVAALARFGTWSGLQITGSSPTDVDPSTHTFSFRTAKYTSQYVSFTGIEQFTNLAATGGGYKPLMSTPAAANAIFQQYSNQQGYPFFDIDNKVLITGASFDPVVLSGLSWSDIAAGLHDPTNTVTQEILTVANFISAGVCASDGQQPAGVCTSSGVTAAAKALKLK